MIPYDEISSDHNIPDTRPVFLKNDLPHGVVQRRVLNGAVIEKDEICFEPRRYLSNLLFEPKCSGTSFSRHKQYILC